MLSQNQPNSVKNNNGDKQSPVTETPSSAAGEGIPVGISDSGSSSTKPRTALQIIFTRKYLKVLLPGIGILFFLIVGMFPGAFIRYSGTEMSLEHRMEKPSAQFWMGTDRFGRDVYSRIVIGTQISYTVSVGSVLFAVLGGVVMGVAGGMFKWFGFVVMRLVDVIICFPPIVVAIFAMALIKPGVTPLIIVVGFLYAPRIGRVVQGAVLETAQAPFVEAQKAVGASLFRIVRKGILPQILAPIVVQATIMLATAMLLEAGLSFLGLGIPPPTPTWGKLISEARRTMHLNFYLLLFPALVLSLNVILINLFGDGLRDILDPKMRGTS